MTIDKYRLLSFDYTNYLIFLIISTICYFLGNLVINNYYKKHCKNNLKDKDTISLYFYMIIIFSFIYSYGNWTNMLKDKSLIDNEGMSYYIPAIILFIGIFSGTIKNFFIVANSLLIDIILTSTIIILFFISFLVFRKNIINLSYLIILFLLSSILIISSYFTDTREIFLYSGLSLLSRFAGNEYKLNKEKTNKYDITYLLNPHYVDFDYSKWLLKIMNLFFAGFCLGNAVVSVNTLYDGNRCNNI